MVFLLDSKGAKRFAKVSGAPPGSSFACGGSVELRAWLCAFVRASDALRCVPARRVLKLSRINGFHLYDLLHAQKFFLKCSAVLIRTSI